MRFFKNGSRGGVGGGDGKFFQEMGGSQELAGDGGYNGGMINF